MCTFVFVRVFLGECVNVKVGACVCVICVFTCVC
jgi:hypothetical protein